MTHNNVPTADAENIEEFENLALEILNILNLNSISPLVISVEGAVTINFLKYLESIGLTKHILLVGQKAVLLQMHQSMQIPRTCTLTLQDRMNLLPLTEPNPTNNMISECFPADRCWEVWLSQQQQQQQ